MVATPRNDYREGRRLILCDLVHDKRLLSTPIVVLDIGARDAFAHTPWVALPPRMVRLHGFEPDPQECAALNQKAEAEGLDFHFHPVALAEHTGLVDFYRYAEEAANSFYPANRTLVERFCYGRGLPLSSQFELVVKQAIEAESMADWARKAGVTAIDFCKLNAQGAELGILRGAGLLLDSVLSIVAEQTFNATYIGAPLFGEVYEFIRGAGFSLFDIIGMNRVARTRSPIHVTEDRIFQVTGTWPHHQCLEGHFLYFRDPILLADQWNSGPGSLSLEQSIKLACIAELFGQIEFAFELLSWIAASPEAGKAGALCREVVGRGAEVYREVSDLPPAEDPYVKNSLLQAELADQASHIAQLEAELTAPTTEIRRMRADLAARADEVARLEAELAARKAEVLGLTDERENLYASSSWRMTAPLRMTKLLISGTLKRLGYGRQ
jgi:FkbM family methyltransferase